MKTNRNLLPLFATAMLLVLLASCVSRRHTVRHNAVQTMSAHIESATDSIRALSALLALIDDSAYTVREEQMSEMDSLALTWDTLGGRVVLTSAVRHHTTSRHDASQSQRSVLTVEQSASETTSLSTSAAVDTSLFINADTLSSAASSFSEDDPMKGGLSRAVAWLMDFVLFILLSIIVALLFKLLCRIAQYTSRDE